MIPASVAGRACDPPPPALSGAGCSPGGPSEPPERHSVHIDALEQGLVALPIRAHLVDAGEMILRLEGRVTVDANRPMRAADEWRGAGAAGRTRAQALRSPASDRTQSVRPNTVTRTGRYPSLGVGLTPPCIGTLEPSSIADNAAMI